MYLQTSRANPLALLTWRAHVVAAHRKFGSAEERPANANRRVKRRVELGHRTVFADARPELFIGHADTTRQANPQGEKANEPGDCGESGARRLRRSRRAPSTASAAWCRTPPRPRSCPRRKDACGPSPSGRRCALRDQPSRQVAYATARPVFGPHGFAAPVVVSTQAKTKQKLFSAQVVNAP